MKLFVLASHPIQYFTPLYQQLAKTEGLDQQVLFCSDESIRGVKDEQFGVAVKWDLPMLEGYSYKFLKNHSPRPSIFKGFWGLMNLGIYRELRGNKGAILLIHGWSTFSMIYGVVIGKILGLKIYFRGENPLSQELGKPKWNRMTKRILLQGFLFKMVDRFLYMGKENKAFYKYFGVKEKQLVFSPYCVDNQRFQDSYQANKSKKTEIRKTLGLPEDHQIILVTGKYISKKRPMDPLKAMQQLGQEQVTLVMVGDGDLRQQMQQYIDKESLSNVVLTGFVNQREIEQYYSAADIFLLPSDTGETWGLVTNEAMNFALPVVISDQPGCVSDLVEEGENGFIYPVGDIEDMVTNLKQLLNSKELRVRMGKRSLEIIGGYSYNQVMQSIIEE